MSNDAISFADCPRPTTFLLQSCGGLHIVRSDRVPIEDLTSHEPLALRTHPVIMVVADLEHDRVESEPERAV